MPKFLVMSALFVIALTVGAGEANAQFGINTQTRIIERAVGRNVALFKPKLVITRGATGPVTAMALSPDERFLVTSVGDNTIRVWDLWIGRELARLPGHADRIIAIAIDPSSKRFATASRDRSVKIWDLKQLGAPVSLAPSSVDLTDLAFAGTTGQLVAAGADGSLTIWSAADGRQLNRIMAHAPGKIVLAASPDGTRVVSGGNDGHLKIWNLANDTPMADIAGLAPVSAITLDHGDGTIAVGLEDGGVQLFTPAGEALQKLSGLDDTVTALGFIPGQGKVIAGTEAGSLAIWDQTRSGSRPRLFSGRHDKAVLGLAASRDGGHALTVSEDGSTRLWNLNTGAQLLTLLSTSKGWAVVDSKGRYDGNEEALAGLEWQADDASANIDDFAETHFEEALLPRTVREGGALADAKSITEGVAFPPKVRIVSDTGDPSARKVTVEVTAEDNGGGVAEIRLYRNGKRIRGIAGDIKRDETRKMVGRFELDLEGGQTVVSATAVNSEKLESRPQTLTLATGRPTREGRIHLLTVGINRYRDRSLDLYYARPDADSIDSYFASGRAAMPVAERISLRDAKANRETILAAIRSFRDVPPEDVVIVYLAGHGVNGGDQWFFIGHDAQLTSDSASDGIVSSGEIKAELEALNADRVVLLIDTCQSGAAIDPIRDYRGVKALRLMARTIGTHILVATDHSQSALELRELRHGIFTYALLDGLAGKADFLGSGMVSATGLIRYVEETVPLLARRHTADEQFPTGYSRGVDFLISRTEIQKQR